MTQDATTLAKSLSEADLDRVGLAIEAAACPGREGPYGGYDYGHKTDFFRGPEPDGGRYVVRDFRDPSSADYGKWVHQTPDREEHEAAFERLTRQHIAQAALDAILLSEKEHG